MCKTKDKLNIPKMVRIETYSSQGRYMRTTEQTYTEVIADKIITEMMMKFKQTYKKVDA